MAHVKIKPTKLINKYTKEEVYTRNYEEVIHEGSNEFIRVFHASNPNRTYLVNRTAFEIARKS